MVVDNGECVVKDHTILFSVMVSRKRFVLGRFGDKQNRYAPLKLKRIEIR